MKIDYEVTYIFRPNLEEADVEERSNAIGELLKTNGGEVLNIEKMGKKRLAYEINDVREGIYVVMRFQSEAATAKELERLMTLNEDVMRALFIKLDKHALAAEKAGPITPPAPVGGPVPLTPPMYPSSSPAASATD
ncbi:MAG TPA: 30S ribosomal protein S6 [Candidatus Baltobacteraceae bacterium]